MNKERVMKAMDLLSRLIERYIEEGRRDEVIDMMLDADFDLEDIYMLLEEEDN